MPGVRLHWYGDRAIARVRRLAFEDLLHLGSQILALARAYCPVDTGTLRASLEIRADPAGLSVAVGSDLEYVIFVHNGTYRYSGNPFLARAVDQVASTVVFA